MTRLTIGLAVCLCCVTPALGAVSGRRDTPLGNSLQRLAAKQSPEAPPTVGAFRVTERTEVKLDGRPCKLEQVPPGATILLLEVASDDRMAILKIHFRSKK